MWVNFVLPLRTREYEKFSSEQKPQPPAFLEIQAIIPGSDLKFNLLASQTQLICI